MTPLCLITLLCYGVTLGIAIARSSVLSFFPSLCWFFLMATPFALQAGEWSGSVATLQGLGIVLIAFTLLVADGWSARKGPQSKLALPRRKWIVEGAIAITLLQCGHLAFMGKIPLVEALRGPSQPRVSSWQNWETALNQRAEQIQQTRNWVPVPPAPESNPTSEALARQEQQRWKASSPADRPGVITEFQKKRSDSVRERVRQWEADRKIELAHLRENASKLSGLPRPFLYLCQAGIAIAPALSLLLWRLGLPWVAGGFALFTVFYAQATLSKSPVVLLGVLYAVLLWPALAPRWKRRLGGAAFVGGTLALAWVAWFQWTHPLSLWNYRVPPVIEEVQSRSSQTSPPLFTLSDHSRLRDQLEPNTPLSWVERKTNYLIYRIFLTPVEVSHRWYHFFPRHSGGFLGFSGNKANAPHPSNQVGRWAYYDRFPTLYLESVHAYASADADAYAHWGILGLLALALATGLLRIGMTVLWASNLWLDSLYRTAVVILGFCLPIASLQATLAAQGVAILLVLMALSRIRLPEARGNRKAGALISQRT